jgi:hypothetical protein
MFLWKQQFVTHELRGSDPPLYSSSARQIRNIQRLVSAGGRCSLASLTILFQSGATAHPAHANLATHTFGELVAICESKREQLQHESWGGEDGSVCLNFVVDLAGLKWPNSPTDQIERTKRSYLSPGEPSAVSLSRYR